MKKNIFLILCLFSSLIYPNKICLTLAIQNDEAVIFKCLESAKGLIDSISVTDLGSTDQTVVEIKSFATKHNIPCSIISSSVSQDLQTLLIENTKQFLNTSLDETYLLFVDPDAVCVVKPSFNKGELKDDVYSIRETSSIISCYYEAPKLVRASFDGKLENSTRLHALQLDVNDHPAYRLLKLERAAVRLKKHLKNDPENITALFELASVHYGLANYDQAILLYQQRLEKEDNKDQVWVSRYRLGECYEKLGKWIDAQYWYLEAYRQTPSRTEPLRKIANHFRLQGENELAYLFAKEGQMSSLATHYLYPMTALSEYQLDEEISISAYYTSHKDEGFWAANRLILKRDVPWNLKNQTYHNIVYYVKNIKTTAKIPISFERPLIRTGSDERYYPMNPSMIKSEMGYDVICRTVNYTQVGSKYYNSHDLDGIIRTRNFLLRYDQEFSLLSQQEIRENLPRKKHHGIYNVTGLEDCRLFSFQGSLWFSCTTLDTNAAGVPQISICKLPREGYGDTLFVEQLTPLIGPDPHRCEKNWLPFVKDGELHMLYSSDPLVLYKPNLQTGLSETVLSYTQALDLTNFRGSAAPIEWEGGYLFLIHEIVYKPDGTRTSLHRLVHFDDTFHLKALSLPFTFNHIGVEYCSGMTLDHSEKQIVFSIGLEDREAYFYLVDIDEINSMLRAL